MKRIGALYGIGLYFDQEQNTYIAVDETTSQPEIILQLDNFNEMLDIVSCRRF